MQLVSADSASCIYIHETQIDSIVRLQLPYDAIHAGNDKATSHSPYLDFPRVVLCTAKLSSTRVWRRWRERNRPALLSKASWFLDTSPQPISSPVACSRSLQRWPDPQELFSSPFFGGLLWTSNNPFFPSLNMIKDHILVFGERIFLANRSFTVSCSSAVRTRFLETAFAFARNLGSGNTLIPTMPKLTLSKCAKICTVNQRCKISSTLTALYWNSASKCLLGIIFQMFRCGTDFASGNNYSLSVFVLRHDLLAADLRYSILLYPRWTHFMVSFSATTRSI